MNNKIEYKKHTQMINNNNKKYIKKKKYKDYKKLFNYLHNQGFINYLPPIEENEQYAIYPYIEEKQTTLKDKAISLINTISELHNKTTNYYTVDKNFIEGIYKTTKEQLVLLRSYYYELQDYFETKEFPSPEEQLLLNNISNIYKAINYSEYKLNMWYEKIKQINKIRYVQLHKNLSLEHFLIGTEPYLINWDKSEEYLPIYDFIIFYKNEFSSIDMKELFDLYQNQYKFTEEEQLLFESLISIPPKITFKKTHLINTIETRKNINYIEMTSDFLLKNNKENQEDNK